MYFTTLELKAGIKLKGEELLCADTVIWICLGDEGKIYTKVLDV